MNINLAFLRTNICNREAQYTGRTINMLHYDWTGFYYLCLTHAGKSLEGATPEVNHQDANKTRHCGFETQRRRQQKSKKKGY